MSEWKEVRLGDICSSQNGYAFKSSSFNPQGKINVIKIKELKNGFVEFTDDTAKLDIKPELDKFIISKGDVLFALTGDPITRPNPSSWVGRVSLYNFNDPAYLNQRVGKIICGDRIDNLFLYYFFRQFSVFKTLASQAKGSASQANISLKDILDTVVKIPLLNEQQEIASILSSLDDKIAVNRRICENLEAQAQALFKHWFIDFAPFLDKPSGKAERKNGKFVESELGMIPEGWRVGRLGDVADITMGQSPAGSSYNEKGEGIFFYQGRTEFGFRYPSVRLYTTEPKRFAEPLSTLLSVRAPVGDINVATDKCCIGRGLASIKSNNNCHSYIFYLLQSMKRRFDVYNGEGTVFGSINKDTLNGLKIIIPSNSILLGFEEIVEEMDKKILGCHQENLRLSTLRDTLLPKLMSGQIKV